MIPGEERLSSAQRSRLDEWLPDRRLVADRSWGLVGTFVLEMRTPHDHVVVKAGDERDRHLVREIRAHREWLRPWTSTGRAPLLLHADPDRRLLVTRWLPGRLVQGAPEEGDPGTFRQAGALLRAFHDQASSVDRDHAAALVETVRTALDAPHRIDPAAVERVRAELGTWPTAPVRVVPTHGDWQPRNWLVHDGEVRVIDFGRAALRPPETDLIRLHDRVFRGRSDLEGAFLDGYGVDPRSSSRWREERLAAAVGTAVWAFAVGDEAFELEGRREVDELLAAR